MKIALLAPEERAAVLRQGLANSGHEVHLPATPSVLELIRTVFQTKPAAVVVAAGIEKAAYAPLVQVYAEGCGIVALCYPAPDAGTLATVAGALGAAVVYPRPNDEGKLTIPGGDILTALDAVTSPRPVWLEAAQADPMLAAAIAAVLEHGGQYSVRLIQGWLHVDVRVASDMARRIKDLPGSMPPTARAPGILQLPQVTAAQKGAQALLRGVLAASKMGGRKGMRPHHRRRRSESGDAPRIYGE